MRHQYRTLKRITRSLSLFLPLLIGGGLSDAAQAQITDTWTGLGTRPNWAGPRNWNDGVPASGMSTGLDFTGAAAISNNNLGTFQLNLLQFDVGADLALSGDALNFVSNGGTAPALNQNTAYALTINNNLTLTNTLTVNLAGSGTVNLAGTILGAGSLTISGTNAAYTALFSNANNSYGGGTIVMGGTLQLGADTALPTDSNLTLTGTAAAATLDLNGHVVTVGNINFADATANSVNNLTIADSSLGTTGLLTLNGNITFNPGDDGNGNMVTPTAYITGDMALSAGQHVIDNNSTGDFSKQNYDMILSGAVSGSGGIDIGSVHDTSTGLFAVLAHTNTYTGPTNLINGSLFTGATNSLPSQSAVTVGFLGNLYLYIASDYTQSKLTPGSYSQTIGSLADNGIAGGGNIYLGSATLMVGGDNTSTTFSGSIQDNDGTSADTTLVGGSLVKVGIGTLTLTGANTYTGVTNIDAGTLVNNGSLASLVNINSSGIAGGTGNYGGGYTINSGGSFLPGTGNGPAGVASGSATWNGGGKFTFQLDDANGTAGTNWSLNQITGQLILAAGRAPASLFTLAMQSLPANGNSGSAANFDPTHSYSWTFVTTTQGIVGFDPGEFAIDTSGFSNPLDGGSFSLAETGDNLSLLFTPATASVPEGSTLVTASLLVLTGGLLLRHRRGFRQRPADIRDNYFA